MTKSDPDTLYHYTDANSLMSILRTQTLWATDAIYLNDSREIRYGIKKFKKVLLSYQPVDELNGMDSTAVGKALAQINSIESSLHDGNARRVYVTCFSAKSDSLSQWRGYGSSGGGFAIGFDRNLLGDLSYKIESENDPLKILHLPISAEAEATDSHIVDPFDIDIFNSKSIIGRQTTAAAFPVGYGSKKAKLICDELVESIVEQEANASYMGQWPQLFTSSIALWKMCLVKHKAFEDEREWRLVMADFVQKPIPEFRSSATLGVVPYIVLNLPKKAIKSIVVGPGRHAKLRAESVKQLLTQLGISDVEVINSEVPFRS
ncbi:DUF2971 domain-containing protein [Rhodococcus globerulus]|uniref:DUF2971 domain-containing protein n=1 Tax=Rhodococcus globerulus TaxID=33008 RepID=A0ABU4BLH0_RHOGO|nr:DUF2971 domain-containing protein [Rhodococcus globerulus]MDV6265071.1 DUF2971 domain-containing protein [Rhodococcus globerulus]